MIHNYQRHRFHVFGRAIHVSTRVSAFFSVAVLLCATSPVSAQTSVTDELHHLRVDGPREWNSFPEQPEAERLHIKFDASKVLDRRRELEKNGTVAADAPLTLQIRQQDVKQVWQVSLNGKRIEKLTQDENDMVRFFAVPMDSLAEENNELTIEQSGKVADDVRVGQIALHAEPPDQLLRKVTLNVKVVDEQSGLPIPCRLTILNENGSLIEPGTKSADHLAVRPGVVYTSTGEAQIVVPKFDEYRVIAGRGFEWSIDERTFRAEAARSPVKINLAIHRQVPTSGWVACDTHVHTLTFSGHGDSSIEERMITIAGEGIELPIATDHNKHIDYKAFAKKLGVSKFFTPVIGNEVTTKIGHFNIFPVTAEESVPDVTGKNWDEVFASIHEKTAARVFILNHGRDLHSNFRPFGPEHHNWAVGENLDGWTIQANAMELINSGATQNDPLQLVRDWFGLLNSGKQITPVGSSDSHDVARHFIGQGRTYIQSEDADPGNIDVKQAVDNFLQGRVMVSYGLLAELTVNDRFGPGDLVPKADEYQVKVRVLGPDWVRTKQVILFANGHPLQEIPIPERALRDLPEGVKFAHTWQLQDLPHDVFLSAVAIGDGVSELYWPTAKPYQSVSPDWQPYTLGISGAIWLDVDGNRKADSARAIAEKKVEQFPDLGNLLTELAKDDPSVSAQTACLLEAQGLSPLDEKLQARLANASEKVRLGFQMFTDAWKESQIARSSN